MTASNNLLLFQEFAQGIAREKVWLSRCGRAAALLDVTEPNQAELYERAVDILNACASEEKVEATTFTRWLDEELGVAPACLHAIILVCSEPGAVRARMRGSLQLLDVSRGAPLRQQNEHAPTTTWRDLDLQFRAAHLARYVVCSNAFKWEVLAKQNRDALEAHDRNAWNRLFSAAAVRPEWSAIAFPVLSSLSYRDPTWRYDPFAGTQEELDHERRGLAEVASALFRHPAFEGFMLLPPPVIFKANSDSLYDALLVSPLGIFLLELKDFAGKAIVSEHGAMLQYPGWPRTQPVVSHVKIVHKMTNDLKKLGNHPVLAPYSTRSEGNWLVGIGAVVFTGNAQVVQVSDGKESPAVGFGAVVLARPFNLAERLKEKALASGKLGQPPRRLPPSDIDSIVANYLGAESSKRHSTRKIGQYTLGQVLSASPYVTTYAARMDFEDRPVWVSEFRPGSLVHADKAPAVAAATFRANAVLLLKLPREETRLQRAYETLERDGQLYAAVEAIPEPTIAEWLAASPPRAERVSLLRELAEVLVVLAERGVTHRALSAANVRVRPGAKPVLTSFDLCHLTSLATLSAEARNNLDRAYLAPEADRPGALVRPAADIYSFGRLLCLVLSGELPFPTHLKQATWSRGPKAFAALAERCGFDDDTMLRRVLSPAASERPTAAECVTWAQTW